MTAIGGHDPSEPSQTQEKPFRRVYSFMQVQSRLGSVRMLSCALCKSLTCDEHGHSIWHAENEDTQRGSLMTYRDHDHCITVRRLDNGELITYDGIV